MKRIIVACANGVATSQAVASKVNRLLKERKVDAVVDAVNIKSLDRDIKRLCGLYNHHKDGKGISGTCYQWNRVPDRGQAGR